MELQGFMFGDKHTLRDFELYLLSGYPEVEFPEVKTEYVDIPGGNGSIDLTESLTGFPTYEDREIKWKFVYVGRRESFPGKYSEIASCLHGKKMRIVFDEDKNHYYIGRVSVESFDRDVASCEVTIKAKCEPYKYNRLMSTDEWEWDDFNFETDYIINYNNIHVVGQESVLVTGGTMPINPVIYSSVEGMKVIIDNVTYTLSSGENQIAGLLITENKTFTFVGTGYVSIEYRGGMF